MATKIAKNPVYYQSQVRPNMDISSWLVDGAATFVTGELCRIASDGLVYEGITGANSGVGDDAVHLYALETVEAAIGADTTRKRFALINKDDQFEMNELDGTVTEAMRGQSYALNVTSNVCTIDTSDTTNITFECVQPVWRIEPLLNDSTDTLARLIVKPLASMLDAAKTN